MSARLSSCSLVARVSVLQPIAVFVLSAFLVCTCAAKVQAQTFKDLHDFTCAADGCNPYYPATLAQGRDGNLYGTAYKGGSNNFGTFFRMTPAGAITVLYHFDSTHGAYPYSGVTLGTDGNFYGATKQGGSSTYGTVFRITPAGVLTVLHNFNSSDGANPYGPPVQASNGNFYGLTSHGTAYRITASGAFTLLNSGLGTMYGPLMQATDGNLYGMTYNAGTGYGTIFRMTLAGAVKTIYTFDRTHGFYPYPGLVQGSDGNLYGTASHGGANGFGVAFKLTTAGVITVLRDFATLTDGAQPFAGLVAASDGNFYGANGTGGSGATGTLFKVTPTKTFSVVYNFDRTHGGYPYATPMQHTNGAIFGLAYQGGASNGGAFYTLTSSALNPFVVLMTFSGKPGQSVQILGQGFNGASSVKFGTGSASFTKVSDTYMTAVVPATGTSGSVTVAVASGTLTSNKKFKVVPVVTSFSPASGAVGSTVTITGSGLTGTTQVTFGGVKVTTFSVTGGTKITASVPAGAITGKIVAKTAGGSATSAGTFNVTP